MGKLNRFAVDHIGPRRVGRGIESDEANDDLAAKTTLLPCNDKPIYCSGTPGQPKEQCGHRQDRQNDQGRETRLSSPQDRTTLQAWAANLAQRLLLILE